MDTTCQVYPNPPDLVCRIKVNLAVQEIPRTRMEDTQVILAKNARMHIVRNPIIRSYKPARRLLTTLRRTRR